MRYKTFFCSLKRERGISMKKITSRVYLLEATKGAYCYLVKIREKEMVLIDTGLIFMRRAILNELTEEKIPLEYIKHIVLTHGDIDHIGNLQFFQKLTGATVWAGIEEIPYILGQKERQGIKKYLSKLVSVKNIKEMKPLRDGNTVDGLEVVETPGHTEGHICLIYDEVLFAGDLVEEKDGLCIPYPVKMNWDTAKLFKSIEKLNAYPFKWVCMAHGTPVMRDELFGDS